MNWGKPRKLQSGYRPQGPGLNPESLEYEATILYIRPQRQACISNICSLKARPTHVCPDPQTLYRVRFWMWSVVKRKLMEYSPNAGFHLEGKESSLISSTIPGFVRKDWGKNDIPQLDYPPLWSSGQSFWLRIQRSRIRFPALPHFLRSRGSGAGFTQPREDNWGATWMKK
jgi:hypothetical protein